jgi:hypothetical protein
MSQPQISGLIEGLVTSSYPCTARRYYATPRRTKVVTNLNQVIVFLRSPGRGRQMKIVDPFLAGSIVVAIALLVKSPTAKEQ